MKHFFLFCTFLCFSFVSIARPDTLVLYKNLKIVKLNKHTYLHISYIPYNGKEIPCNGLIYINKGEAIVLDSPTTDSGSIYLIEWVEHHLHAKIKAIVVNHFHEDCLGGISIFTDYGAKTYAQKQTCKLADQNGFSCTQMYFKDTLTLSIGDRKVECWYPGPAHTVDNTVAYLPKEKILFGGCMIKALGADQGNIRDADLTAWAATVKLVEDRYQNAKLIIPGHGKPGDRALFNYTIKLFQTN